MGGSFFFSPCVLSVLVWGVVVKCCLVVGFVGWDFVFGLGWGLTLIFLGVMLLVLGMRIPI